jgi:ketosteroid isomerase-like protein
VSPPNRSAHNARIVAAVYRAIAANDPEAFERLVHPEIEVEQPPWLPYGGTHRGLAGVGEMFRKVLKLIDVSRLEVQSLTAEGDIVWATFVIHARDDGSPLLLAEEWQLEGDRCRRLRVWHFDPRPVLRQLNPRSAGEALAR